jgi:hypothetical protein
VSFLSHVISEEGMLIESSMIRHPLSWNAPACVVNIRSPLGILGYYRRFIEGILRDNQAHDRVA